MTLFYVEDAYNPAVDCLELLILFFKRLYNSLTCLYDCLFGSLIIRISPTFWRQINLFFGTHYYSWWPYSHKIFIYNDDDNWLYLIYPQHPPTTSAASVPFDGRGAPSLTTVGARGGRAQTQATGAQSHYLPTAAGALAHHRRHRHRVRYHGAHWTCRAGFVAWEIIYRFNIEP